LQAALNSALAAAGPGRDRLAIAIVALNSGGDRPLAQVRGDEEYYSASLMKVCAMYAAYELREVLRGMAKELGAPGKAANFLQQASKYLNPLIWRLRAGRGEDGRQAAIEYDGLVAVHQDAVLHTRQDSATI
jgi:hypothetical protein